MGYETPPTIEIPTIPGDVNIIAPFAADADPSVGGSVEFTSYLINHPGAQTVSSFIRSRTNSSFFGRAMLVTEWRQVPEHGRDRVSV